MRIWCISNDGTFLLRRRRSRSILTKGSVPADSGLSRVWQKVWGRGGPDFTFMLMVHEAAAGRGGEGRGWSTTWYACKFYNVLLCNGYAVVVVEERKVMADGAWCMVQGCRICSGLCRFRVSFSTLTTWREGISEKKVHINLVWKRCPSPRTLG